MENLYNLSTAYAFVKAVVTPSIRPALIRCLRSIAGNFFLAQFRAAFLPGRIPVSRVDHPLDRRIPFAPQWIGVYLDFIKFWIRMLTFLMLRFGRRAFPATAEFLLCMGRLYAFAAEVYRQNLSTMERPLYLARARFLPLRLLDPHLMCVPSLHVMVAVFSYVKFEAMLGRLGDPEIYRGQVAQARRGALAISRSVLFVKQHSVNCIGASLYAVARFAPELFPRERALDFCSCLFQEAGPSPLPWLDCIHVTEGPACNSGNCRKCPLAVPHTPLPPDDAAEIKAHIAAAYLGLADAGKTAKSWEEPILSFLQKMPRVP
ncbi:MAG: hypothetical protein FWD94_02880 [Treponema sp.]|nr:hypothetical protein [Treponema sp.]